MVLSGTTLFRVRCYFCGVKGLDFEAVEDTEKVKKEQEIVSEWTLKRSVDKKKFIPTQYHNVWNS